MELSVLYHKSISRIMREINSDVPEQHETGCLKLQAYFSRMWNNLKSADPSEQEDGFLEAQAAAEYGVLAFFTAYGLCYLEGIGCEPNIAQGIMWLEKAVANNELLDEQAFLLFSEGCQKHRILVNKSKRYPQAYDVFLRRTISYLEVGAGEGNPRYLRLLGVLYGELRQPDEAARCLRAAASLGDDEALELLLAALDDPDYILTEDDLRHPFACDSFLPWLLGGTEAEGLEGLLTYPGLSLSELTDFKARFKETFGFYPPKDYLAFLHHHNGYNYNGCTVAGVDVDEPYMDIFKLQTAWIPGAAGPGAVLLGRDDDIRYLYLPLEHCYAACEFTIEEQYADIWELLRAQA